MGAYNYIFGEVRIIMAQDYDVFGSVREFRPISHALCIGARRCKSIGAARAVLATSLFTDGVDTMVQMVAFAALAFASPFHRVGVRLTNHQWGHAVGNAALIPVMEVGWLLATVGYAAYSALKMPFIATGLCAIYKVVRAQKGADEILLDSEKYAMYEEFEKGGKVLKLPWGTIKEYREKDNTWEKNPGKVLAWKVSKYCDRLLGPKNDLPGSNEDNDISRKTAQISITEFYTKWPKRHRLIKKYNCSYEEAKVKHKEAQAASAA